MFYNEGGEVLAQVEVVDVPSLGTLNVSLDRALRNQVWLKMSLVIAKGLGYHRITELSGMEGSSGDHPVQPSCHSSITCSRLHSNVSRWV